ncbi:MAG: hypothetical protein AB9891_15365 [Anaerolineaceae bacterium]
MAKKICYCGAIADLRKKLLHHNHFIKARGVTNPTPARLELPSSFAEKSVFKGVTYEHYSSISAELDGKAASYPVELQGMRKLTNIFRITVILLLAVLILGGSALPPADELEQVRFSTREIEFDYIEWTLDAMMVKMEASSLPIPDYLDPSTQVRFVRETMKLVDQINLTNAAIESIYSDPAIEDPEQAAAPLLKSLEEYKAIMERAAPVTEAIIQGQIGAVLAQCDLTLAGQAIPPVLYHVTPLPLALIVSPRDIIQQDANISLAADLAMPERLALEEEVSRSVGKSALVVEIGGVGVYPTMVMSTSDLRYLVETVAHEWIHNYLTLRPLGLNYETSPELRTMNETTASIAGKEIGLEVLKVFYPDKVPPPEIFPEDENNQDQTDSAPPEEDPDAFNYRAEMHETRVKVDALLARGKIDEAEEYMETRRVFLWENGYQIRKLNQAYFAFYGAYADSPGGAAGEDPVGPAVRALRSRSDSLAAFINRISWMDSFEALIAATGEAGPD